ncbi:hypothetical protein SAMN04487944_11520 [Gracilibacillus ureilyticus]|uniref:Lipoprotein n=1 Tax=Gracilibacillus ureilyticus TaxID=531814 RepID=A0A1H9TVX8_9BACI|nr:hypothetical protein [Gracilibacillus ureilyticus]SES01385.1 hypothetical protein SAMN04487944_11520 [Gracilibacillus ureilyticus]
MRKINAVLLLIIFIVMVGCSAQERHKPTIKISKDSVYEQTFNDLNLGIIFDFDFYLPDADKSWITVWVERYKDGEKIPEPKLEFSFSNSPDKVEEGKMGLGILDANTEESRLFFYAPGVKFGPEELSLQANNRMNTWDYAIGEEKTEIEIGKEILLAIYRETEDNSMSNTDLKDEKSIERIIETGDTVMLLKMIVEKESRSN